MAHNRTASPTISVCEVAVISVLCGMLLGSLALCLCNPITALCGVELTCTFSGIGFRCGVAFVLSLLGLAPLIAVARIRNDVISFVLGGPQLVLWGCLAFLTGGVMRWGTPPEFMWPIFAGFILYGVVLQSVVSIAVRKGRVNQAESSLHSPGSPFRTLNRLGALIAVLGSLLAVAAYFMPFQSHAWSLWGMAHGYHIAGGTMSGAIVAVVQTAPSAVGLLVLLDLALSRLPRVVLSILTAYFITWIAFQVAFVAEFLGLPSLSCTLAWATLAWGVIPLVAVVWVIVTLRGWRRRSTNEALLFLGCMFLLCSTLEISFSLLEDRLLLNYGAVISTVASVLIVLAFVWKIAITRANVAAIQNAQQVDAAASKAAADQ